MLFLCQKSKSLKGGLLYDYDGDWWVILKLGSFCVAYKTIEWQNEKYLSSHGLRSDVISSNAITFNGYDYDNDWWAILKLGSFCLVYKIVGWQTEKYLSSYGLKLGAIPKVLYLMQLLLMIKSDSYKKKTAFNLNY